MFLKFRVMGCKGLVLTGECGGAFHRLQGHGICEGGCWGLFRFLKAVLSVILEEGARVCARVLASSPCCGRGAACSFPSIQPEVAVVGVKPRILSTLRNVCGFSKPQPQAEEWVQDRAQQEGGDLRRVPTRQVWSEARFGVGLIKKLHTAVSGIPAHCPKLVSLPTC